MQSEKYSDVSECQKRKSNTQVEKLNKGTACAKHELNYHGQPVTEKMKQISERLQDHNEA